MRQSCTPLTAMGQSAPALCTAFLALFSCIFVHQARLISGMCSFNVHALHAGARAPNPRKQSR